MLDNLKHSRIAPFVVALIIAAPAAAQSGGITPGGKAATDPGSAGADGKGGVFPIRGRHTYGDGLGAGRGHQGQDLLAKCGKPVVAAQTGRVRKVGSDSSMGYHAIIKTKSSRVDQVYMHMLARPRVERGELVEAGETIGRVGNTGSSTACHLHFEMWSAPGWYKGGDVLDPTPSLKRWDRGR